MALPQWTWRGLQGPAAGQLRAALRAAAAQGARVELTGGNHIRILPPDGGAPVYAPLTSRSPQASKRVKAQLRQRGLNMPGDPPRRAPRRTRARKDRKDQR